MTFAETATSSKVSPSWRIPLVTGAAVLNGLFGWTTATAAEYEPVEPRSGTTATFPTQLVTSRVEQVQIRSVADALLEVRRLSGLTWQELADVLKVQRRTLHLWASGKPISAPNEHRLKRLLSVMRRLDRGEAARNRSLLLEPRVGSITVFDLLAEERFREAVESVGEGQGRPPRPSVPLAPEAAHVRQPAPPAELVGALQNRIHEIGGKPVRSKVARLKTKKKA